MHLMRWSTVGVLAILTWSSVTRAADKEKPGYKDTPLLPGGKWHVHDSDRPYPTVVTPGPAQQPAAPPSDAIVLFNGKDLSRWRSGGDKPADWNIENGILVIQPRSGTINTRDEFGDCQLHLEWAAPLPATGSDQGRGNSGILFFGRYEIQILDCYKNPTYADGHAAAIYGQHPPMVNACRPPGQWQTYDIAFTAPRFKQDGSLEAPAYVTMFHNGLLVHDHAEVFGPVAWRDREEYKPHPPKGSIALQDHGNPVQFRNIWIRALTPADQDAASAAGSP